MNPFTITLIAGIAGGLLFCAGWGFGARERPEPEWRDEYEKELLDSTTHINRVEAHKVQNQLPWLSYFYDRVSTSTTFAIPAPELSGRFELLIDGEWWEVEGEAWLNGSQLDIRTEHGRTMVDINKVAAIAHTPVRLAEDET